MVNTAINFSSLSFFSKFIFQKGRLRKAADKVSGAREYWKRRIMRKFAAFIVVIVLLAVLVIAIVTGAMPGWQSVFP